MFRIEKIPYFRCVSTFLYILRGLSRDALFQPQAVIGESYCIGIVDIGTSYLKEDFLSLSRPSNISYSINEYLSQN